MSEWFDEAARPALVDFWALYDAHFDEVTRAVVARVGSDAATVATIRAATRERVRRGVFDGDWRPYEELLHATAHRYAASGAAFGVWHAGASVLPEIVQPHVVRAYASDPARMIAVLDVMRRFVDRVVVVVATAFIEEKEARLRALASRQQSALEEERTRMAREIHDELGQRLTAIKLDLGWAQRHVENERVRERLGALVALSDSTLATMRKLATQLRPAVLDDLGLVAALGSLARELASRTGLDVRTTFPDGDASVSRDEATAVFRVVQELLTNVARHAEATRVEIALRFVRDRRSLSVEVRDDGRGITREQALARSSLGLIGVRERIASLGGDFTIEGAEGHGTRAMASFPLGGAT